MTDIVERLRDQGKDAFAKQYSLGMFKLCDEAAAEIERLRAALAATPAVGGEALRTALDIHELELTETMRDLGLRSKVRTIEVVFSKLREAAAQPASPLRGREWIAETIGYHLAMSASGNNQPHMSGDPRNRISPLRRRHFDEACLSAADAILCASPPEQPAAAPVTGSD